MFLKNRLESRNQRRPTQNYSKILGFSSKFKNPSLNQEKRKNDFRRIWEEKYLLLNNYLNKLIICVKMLEMVYCRWFATRHLFCGAFRLCANLNRLLEVMRRQFSEQQGNALDWKCLLQSQGSCGEGTRAVQRSVYGSARIPNIPWWVGRARLVVDSVLSSQRRHRPWTILTSAACVSFRLHAQTSVDWHVLWRLLRVRKILVINLQADASM